MSRQIWNLAGGIGPLLKIFLDNDNETFDLDHFRLQEPVAPAKSCMHATWDGAESSPPHQSRLARRAPAQFDAFVDSQE
jgi:hypothetical protein